MDIRVRFQIVGANGTDGTDGVPLDASSCHGRHETGMRLIVVTGAVCRTACGILYDVTFWARARAQVRSQGSK